MNKLVFALLITLSCSTYISAQDDSKIKGNRDVTIKQTYIDPFNTIVVGEDFSVEIIYNQKASVEIETDDNLHDVVRFEVIDSVLVFKTSKKITTRKKMRITVNYTDVFEHIETKDDGEIRSLTSLELKNASLKTSGTSKAYLNIKTNNFYFNSTEKAKVKLNLSANSSKIDLGDNSKLDALINTKEFKLDGYQRANIDLEGTAENAIINVDNSANFNGTEFTTNNCLLICDINSDIYIDVTESIQIEASGSSEVYLYGSPQITILKFAGSAKLQKKIK